ncbi:MAG: hypothetical protein LBQ35_02040 [Spirochaetaceae bacterium]|jgi:hypothetical protein|nr:hypothetical protein [Spirochaetaceae bacterium]
MKKPAGFLILFLFLLGGAAALFLAGWAQLKVPLGSVAVMRSKTHGVDPEPLGEGRFRWVWYKLIPTNVEISVFTLDPVERTFHLTGNLPSAEIYRAFASLDTDFPYEISGALSFTIRESALPSLLAGEGLRDQAGLEALEERLAEEIIALIRGRLTAYAAAEAESAQTESAPEAPDPADTAGPDAALLETIFRTGSAAALEEELAGRYGELEDLRLSFRSLVYPDFSLYRSVRGLYEDFLALQRALLTAPLSEMAGRRMETRVRLEELSLYGELLTKYPVLLQYLSIENGGAVN